MNHTTEEHKEIANRIAKEITEQIQKIGGDECIVDDFGKFGNFSLLCYLDMGKSYGKGYHPRNRSGLSLVKIVNVIKRVIRKYEDKGARLRTHECPHMIRSQQRIRNFTKSYFEGYEKRYISIDLDFIPYHEPSNTFAIPYPEQTDVHPNQLTLF